tara:strand:- start:1397 stop:1942 length:546 start_codon:yes stop_codon:yes gene_type:complete
MKISRLFILPAILLSYSAAISAADCPTLLGAKQRLLNSDQTINLCEQFKGKTLLVVNTASQCGFTSQYSQLEQLHQKYKANNFAVVGFPSNDFKQDRGSEENTAKVCYLDYGVTFPMMARSSVKGHSANHVFTQITQQAGVEPRWNFYKYLIDANGQVVATFPSSTSPMNPALIQTIEKHL